MRIGDRVYQRLAASVPLSLFVGQRIYPVKGPESPTYPLVTYQIVSEVPVNSLDGFSRLSQVRFQIDAWARKRTDALDIASTIAEAMTRTDEWLHRTLRSTRREDYDSSVKVHRVSSDFIVWAIDDVTSS